MRVVPTLKRLRHAVTPQLFFFPTTPNDLEMKDNVATVTIKRALGPNEQLEVDIPEVRNRNGNVEIVDSKVYSDAGIAMHQNHIEGLSEEQKRKLWEIE